MSIKISAGDVRMAKRRLYFIFKQWLFIPISWTFLALSLARLVGDLRRVSVWMNIIAGQDSKRHSGPCDQGSFHISLSRRRHLQESPLLWIRMPCLKRRHTEAKAGSRWGGTLCTEYRGPLYAELYKGRQVGVAYVMLMLLQKAFGLITVWVSIRSHVNIDHE